MGKSECKLAGRVALITGASSGIGAKIAELFSDAGAKVFLVARRDGPLREMCDLIGNAGQVAEFGTADVADPMAISRSFDRATEVLGSVDCLVNAAGALRVDEKPHSFEDHEWDALVNTNFRGVRNTTREFLSRLRVRGAPGVILNIGSISASLAVPGYATYSATKAAVIAYTRVVAAQYGKHGVRANCLSPGVVNTPMTVDYEGVMHSLGGRHPLKRIGEPRDVAMLALYLCSDDAAWITGQNFIVDGGLSLAGFDL